MKVVIVGASGSLGKALAYNEAKPGNSLLLIASDERDLKALAADIGFRCGCENVQYLALDLSAKKCSDEVPDDGNRYYFPIGLTVDTDNFSTGHQEVDRLFRINFLSVSNIISNILLHPRTASVEIIGFGSIAETRGRSSNVFYSASKRCLTSVFESLLHGSETQMVRPFLFQIGYMESQLSFGKKLLFPPVAAGKIALAVETAIKSKRPGIYYMPGFWRWICLVLKQIPWSIYRKMKF